MKGVIFDMDGVIVDSEKFHRAAWIAFGEEIGKPVSDEFFKKTFGKTNKSILEELFGQKLDPTRITEFALLKETYYRDSLKGQLKALPGAIELAKELKASGIKLAIGTSAPRENVSVILSELKAIDLFDAISSDEDYWNGKPAPDVFQVAARKLNLRASDCLVIEDAAHGVEAALAAGCKCLAVTTTNTADVLKNADKVCNSLAEVSNESLLSIFE